MLFRSGLHRAIELVQLLSHATRARHALQDGRRVSSMDAFQPRSTQSIDEVRRGFQLGDAPSEQTKVRLEVAQAADELRVHPQRLDGAFRHERLAHERDDPRGPAEVSEPVHRSREVSGAAFLPAMEVGAVVIAIGLVHLVDRRVPTLARDGVSGAPDVFPEVLRLPDIIRSRYPWTEKGKPLP